jgi:hypothetical protein
MAGKSLSPAALAFRVVHGVITASFLSCIAYVWWCVLTGRRDRLLGYIVGALVSEGACVAANGGDCPLGPIQDRLEDPVPFFELVLRSPRAAKLAVPVLGGVAAVGIVLLAHRGPLIGRG